MLLTSCKERLLQTTTLQLWKVLSYTSFETLTSTEKLFSNISTTENIFQDFQVIAIYLVHVFFFSGHVTRKEKKSPKQLIVHFWSLNTKPVVTCNDHQDAKHGISVMATKFKDKQHDSRHFSFLTHNKEQMIKLITVWQNIMSRRKQFHNHRRK